MDDSLRKKLEELNEPSASALARLGVADQSALFKAQEMLNKSSSQAYLDEHSAAYYAAKLGTTTVADILSAKMNKPNATDLSMRTIQDIERVHDLKYIVELQGKLSPMLASQLVPTTILDSEAYRVVMRNAETAFQALQRHQDYIGVNGQLSGAQYDYASMLALHANRSAIESASSALDSHWASRIGAFGDIYGASHAAEFALESHYLSVSTTALLAQEYASRLSLSDLGAATPFPTDDFTILSERFVGLSDLYGNLLRSYDKEPHHIASLPPVVSEGPPKEMLENAALLSALSSDDPDEELAESVAMQRQQREWEEPTSAMLRSLNPSLEIAFIGAIQALHSTNVDRARHVIVSLRELVTHVLHHLAPDVAVMAWIVDPKHLHEGKPTRAARMYYICRAINGGAFAEFVEADVRSAIACIALFQKGTHKIESGFNDAQLGAIVNRTECMLRFLITTARTAI